MKRPTPIRVLANVEASDVVTRHRVLIARELIDNIARLDVALKTSKKRVKVAIVASATMLTDIVGIGPICAAVIIGFTGDVTRFPTKGHFATSTRVATDECCALTVPISVSRRQVGRRRRRVPKAVTARSLASEDSNRTPIQLVALGATLALDVKRGVERPQTRQVVLLQPGGSRWPRFLRQPKLCSEPMP